MTKIAVIVSLLLAVVSISAPSISSAQNTSTNTSAEQNQTKPIDSKNAKLPKESKSRPEKVEAATTTRSPNREKERKSNGGIFKPSEEISEDFAVSFPVDI